MAVHPSAGRPAPADGLVDVAELVDDYFEQSPDVADPAERVSFRHQRPPERAAGVLKQVRRGKRSAKESLEAKGPGQARRRGVDDGEADLEQRA